MASQKAVRLRHPLRRSGKHTLHFERMMHNALHQEDTGSTGNVQPGVLTFAAR